MASLLCSWFRCLQSSSSEAVADRVLEVVSSRWMTTSSRASRTRLPSSLGADTLGRGCDCLKKHIWFIALLLVAFLYFFFLGVICNRIKKATLGPLMGMQQLSVWSLWVLNFPFFCDSCCLLLVTCQQAFCSACLWALNIFIVIASYWERNCRWDHVPYNNARNRPWKLHI